MMMSECLYLCRGIGRCGLLCTCTGGRAAIAQRLARRFKYSDRYAKQFGTGSGSIRFLCFKCKQGWDFIAARDGAITVYNFRKMLDRVTSLLHLCPTLQSKNIQGETTPAEEQIRPPHSCNVCKKRGSRMLRNLRERFRAMRFS